SLPGITCPAKLTPSDPDREAKPGPPMLPSPARGGGLRWGPTPLVAILKSGKNLGGRRAEMRGRLAITGRAKRLRRNMTEAERTLWNGLRYEQLGWRFRRQHPIPPYVVDFACVEARLVVEADGGQHGTSNVDHLRDELLPRRGWRIVRF